MRKQKNRIFISKIESFKIAIDLTYDFLQAQTYPYLFSFYSIIPIIDKIFNLDSFSRYKDFLYYKNIYLPPKDKEGLNLKRISKISLEERRIIKEEINNMLTSILLHEEKNYIQNVKEVIYTSFLDSSSKIDRAIKSLEYKFAILKSMLSKLAFKGGDFAHLAHFGETNDLISYFPFLKDLPDDVKELWFEYSYPIVYELCIKDSLYNEKHLKPEINGWVILIPNSAEQLLRNGRVRNAKILKAALLAKKLGAKIMGMGGLIGSFTKGGHFLSKFLKGIGFTTGHSYTLVNILNIIDISCKKFNFNLGDKTIAIVGAAGSIGSGCAKLLVKRGGLKKMILVDSNSIISWKKLNELIGKLKRFRRDTQIILSTNIEDIREADLIIIATNSPFSLVKGNHLRPGAVVIDDSFPKNVSEDVVRSRKDVIFLEGGTVKLPNSFDIYASQEFPTLTEASLNKLLTHKYAYSSFSETLILSFTEHNGNYTLGSGNIDLIEDIEKKAKRVGIFPKLLQCYGKDDKKEED